MAGSQHYRASTQLGVSKQQAFAYHERPGALQRLTPPWESVSVEKGSAGLDVGSRVVLKMRLLGVPLRWVAEHTLYDPPNRFDDTQRSGPFASWSHSHQFDADGGNDSKSVLTDSIHYRLPGGQLGRWFGGGFALKKIESMFAYRHRITRDDLELFSAYSSEAMRVAISGSHGLVGSQLLGLLSLFGHETQRIVRSSPSEDRIAAWQSDQQASRLNGVDAVVHLAGASIASRRWSDVVKREIRESRVLKTRQLCESLARLPKKPRVLVCASATGVYGDRQDQVLDEHSAHGEGFLADVADQWERACRPAVDAGIRVVHARFGLILSRQGGALAKMLLPAKLAGGSLGSGHQWWSWIAMDDVLGGIYHAIQTDSLSGPVNFVSPTPVQNRDFAKVLGSVMHRPALLPAPAFGLRIALGEMADALLLASTRVVPVKLQQSGYRFRFNDLAETLRYSLGKDRLKSSPA
ncbi:TIGR01777 family oxidoreductase [Novipirellula artificiosorum]|uniref:Epimerase family protein n=1 Tax=Novipirellula artificiosorum TaxID=2528016 RepID=A0A5C6E3C9_9BACT|nr:TIGR01777 family oxidoreductase [Novipirellula artificiosorum]TWU41916.1 Epimerase family protein [Novipirellula artificiosorum]